MSKVSTKLKEEFFALLPPTIFFFVALHIVTFVRVLMLKGLQRRADGRGEEERLDDDQHEGRLEDHLPVREELNFDTHQTNSRRRTALDQGPMAKLNRENHVALQCNNRLAERL